MFSKSVLISASLALFLLLGLSYLHPANAQAGLDQVECLKYINDCSKDSKALQDALAGKATEASKELCCAGKSFAKCVKEKMAGDAKCKDVPFKETPVTGCDKFPTCGVSALTSLSVGLTLFIAICARVFFH